MPGSVGASSQVTPTEFSAAFTTVLKAGESCGVLWILSPSFTGILIGWLYFLNRYSINNIMPPYNKKSLYLRISNS